MNDDNKDVVDQDKEEATYFIESLQAEFPDVDRTKLEEAAQEAFRELGPAESRQKLKDQVRELLKLRRDDPNNQAAIRL